MKRVLAPFAMPVAVVLVLAGCKDQQVQRQKPAPDAKTESSDTQDVSFGGDAGYGMRVPRAWKKETPANAQRMVQFCVPGQKRCAENAELVVSIDYTGGGVFPYSPAAITANWSAQFGGKEAVKNRREIATAMTYKQTATITDFEGTYTPAPPTGTASPKQNHKMIGALIHEWGCYLCVTLVGPRATVEANKAAFDKAVASFRGGWVDVTE
ncbi:MAG: hypothetical protein NTW87_28470 [Planctomycetota bacterium]|nr:hypothetical protein [Planctomycetota bacterium]